MELQKRKKYLSFLIIFAVFFSTKVTAQMVDNDLQTDLANPAISTEPDYNLKFLISTDRMYQSESSRYQHFGTKPRISIETDDSEVSKNRKTSSLTVGNIVDEFSIESDNGSYRFGYYGRTKGLKISSKSSLLMLSYGLADAQENEGDIRSITADLSAGGNITIFRKLFGIPVSSFIPIRAIVGYRNLSLLDNQNPEINNIAHIGTGSLGAGLGSEIRLRTKKTALNKNLLLSGYLVSSAGVIGDFNSIIDNTESGDLALKDIRLTKGTDYNFEIKLERLIGGKVGLTFGLTVRFLYWTREGAEEVRQILDVISGKQEDLELRAKQSFFRIGFNW